MLFVSSHLEGNTFLSVSGAPLWSNNHIMALLAAIEQSYKTQVWRIVAAIGERTFVMGV